MDLIRWARNEWDRVAGVVFVVGGALAIGAGWLGVSRTAHAAQSLPYIISGGFFGLVLVAVGSVLWLSADLRDEWRKLDGIERACSDAEVAELPPPVAVETKVVDSGQRASVAR